MRLIDSIVANNLELNALINSLKSQCKPGTCLYIPFEVKDNKIVCPNFQFPVLYQPDVSQDDISTEVNSDISPIGTKISPIQEEPKRIGRYTMKERQERIKRYKEKILRWRQGLSSKDLYAKRRVLAQAKPRFQGRFVKQTSS